MESANNAFLNLTQSISLEGYLKIMTHTHTHTKDVNRMTFKKVELLCSVILDSH